MSSNLEANGDEVGGEVFYDLVCLDRGRALAVLSYQDSLLRLCDAHAFGLSRWDGGDGER